MDKGSQQVVKQKIIDRLITLLSDKVEFALVFGSLANKNFRKDSDIDVAIYQKTPFTRRQDEIEFHLSLAQEFNRELDVIFLNRSDLIITMQVLTNGKLIINHNSALFIQFKALTISEYIDFKISRRIIEKNLLNGRLYA